jgi:hypothetical protein
MCKHIAWQIPQQTFGIRPTSRRFEIARLGYAIAVVQACVVNKKKRVHGRRPSKKDHAASQTGNVSCASQPSNFFSTAHRRRRDSCRALCLSVLLDELGFHTAVVRIPWLSGASVSVEAFCGCYGWERHYYYRKGVWGQEMVLVAHQVSAQRWFSSI